MSYHYEKTIYQRNCFPLFCTFLHSTILSELRNWSFDTRYRVLCDEPARAENGWRVNEHRAERVRDTFPPFDKKEKLV